jgi:hypothetical protein
MAPGALAAPDAGNRNVRTGTSQLLVTPVDDPSVKDVPPGPAVAPNDPEQVLQDYESLMIALTQKFTASLARSAAQRERQILK